MDMINQDVSKKQTKLKLFCFFQHFRFGFCIEKSQKPKINLEFLLLSWLIISIQQKHVFFSFFHFKTKTKQKKPREHKKMSQNQTLSHMFCFLDLWFCSFLFLFVHWFTWLPSVSLCFLTITAQIYWNIEVQKCPPWAPLLWDIVFPVVLYMPLYAPPQTKNTTCNFHKKGF
jgi:hypothetical protein